MSGRVAYVMVNHNGGDELLASVDSLLADLRPDDRLFLVDNGSRDGSGPGAAQRSQVTFLTHPENRPFAAAVNQGVDAALAEGYRYIGPINPDVRIRPGMTDALVHRLERPSEEPVAAVSPVMLYDYPNERVWYAGGVILFPVSFTLHRYNGKLLSDVPNEPFDTRFVTGCCWLSRAAVWNEIGRLDPSYGMYAEDVDWSTRSWRAEMRMIVDPAAVLVHRVSSSSGGGRSPFKMVYRTLATRLFFARWTPPCLRILRALGTPPFVALYAIFLLSLIHI